MDKNQDASSRFNSLKLVKLRDLVHCVAEEAYEKLQLSLQGSVQENGEGFVVSFHSIIGIWNLK